MTRAAQTRRAWYSFDTDKRDELRTWFRRSARGGARACSRRRAAAAHQAAAAAAGCVANQLSKADESEGYHADSSAVRVNRADTHRCAFAQSELLRSARAQTRADRITCACRKMKATSRSANTAYRCCQTAGRCAQSSRWQTPPASKTASLILCLVCAAYQTDLLEVVC